MDPLIVLDRITTRVRDQFILKDTSWEIREGEHWAIIGPNGSGKTSLARVISGDLPVIFGKRTYREGFNAGKDIGVVSFEIQRGLLDREAVRNQFRSFSGNVDEKTTPRLMFHENDLPSRNLQQIDRVERVMGIADLLDRDFARLSTGEMHKVLIARALLREPKILILDEPFEGLDTRSRRELEGIINLLIRKEIQVTVVTHRLDAIPSEITHILCLKEARIVAKGKKKHTLESGILRDLFASKRGDIIPFERSKGPSSMGKLDLPDELVRMKAVSVTYADHKVFKGLNWTVRRGENWMISGPNGAGKTTLLLLLTGDNLQAYANEIYLFGKRRGTGESIWDIKGNIGIVSSEFQLRYRHAISVEEVVLSGFFDSVGLYRESAVWQRDTARKWIDFLGIEQLRDKIFTRLSFGEQKMVLIARAMVKSPLILALDEPCQGLDPANRKLVLNVIDRIARDPGTTVLYVTHHPDDRPASITKTLDLEEFSLKAVSA